MKKPVSIAFDEGLLRRVDLSAKKKGLSRSRFIETILEKGLDTPKFPETETKVDSPPPPESVPDKAEVISDLQARIDKLARTRYRTLPTPTARRMAAKDLK